MLRNELSVLQIESWVDGISPLMYDFEKEDHVTKEPSVPHMYALCWEMVSTIPVETLKIPQLQNAFLGGSFWADGIDVWTQSEPV